MFPLDFKIRRMVVTAVITAIAVGGFFVFPYETVLVALITAAVAAVTYVMLAYIGVD